MKKTYKIEVDCAACAAKMEEAAKKTAGVKDATVAFMPQKMKVEFEEGADVENVMANVLKNCKKVESDCEIFLS
ncbi:MAG: cation transporter [Lachnospiraceae bacterium]|jgi:cation transport ATPase